jgi:hypothetical protein
VSVTIVSGKSSPLLAWVIVLPLTTSSLTTPERSEGEVSGDVSAQHEQTTVIAILAGLQEVSRLRSDSRVLGCKPPGAYRLIDLWVQH